MEWYYKNRRRCNISKKRLKKYFVRIFFSILFVFVISFFCIYLIDIRINSVLLPYINVEVERLATNIINNAINNEMKNVNIRDLLSSENDNYNTTRINEIENRINERIQQELINIDEGKIDDYFIPKRIKTGRFKKIKNGILCDISIGSIRGSTLFANVGPTIPIKLLFSSGLNSNISVDISEYGINNVIIKVYFNVDINEQINMPISSKRKKISIKKIIAMDIIKGEIPNYYAGLIN